MEEMLSDLPRLTGTSCRVSLLSNRGQTSRTPSVVQSSQTEVAGAPPGSVTRRGLVPGEGSGTRRALLIRTQRGLWGFVKGTRS